MDLQVATATQSVTSVFIRQSHRQPLDSLCLCSCVNIVPEKGMQALFVPAVVISGNGKVRGAGQSKEGFLHSHFGLVMNMAVAGFEQTEVPG